MATTAPRAVVRLPLTAATAAVLLIAVLSVFGSATPAAAHAALTGSSPAQGSVVATAPDTVTLTFSEKVAMSDDSIRVLDPDGKRVDTGELQEDLGSGSVITYGVTLRPEAPDGTLTVAWQAVSADSHPISGAFTFSIGAPSKTTVDLPEQTVGGGTVGALYGVARYAAYTGFILLTGGAAFVLGCWRQGGQTRPIQRLVVTGWATLTAATLTMLLLRHPYTTTGALSDAFDLTGLKSVLDTKPGAALVSRLLLLAVAALFVSVLFGTLTARHGETTGHREEKDRRDLLFGLAIGGTVIATGLGATWAMAEHASAGIQSGIAMPSHVLHLLAVACWLGGLAALVSTLYWGPPVPRTAVRRFSGLAFGSVLVLAATGLYQSWRQVGSWSALTSTSYGQLLIVKAALVGLLVGMAWFSRRWTARLAEVPPTATATATATADDDTPGDADQETPTPTPTADPDTDPDPERAAQLARQRTAVAAARRKRNRDADPERAGLRRSVLAETAVAVVLLAVATALTSTEPARTVEAARAASPGATTAVPDRPVSLSVPFDTGGPEGKGTAQLKLDPGRSGDNSLDVRTDVDAAEIKVAFTLPDKNIGPLPVTPGPVAKDKRRWRADGVQLPIPGEWEIAVTIRTSDIDQVTETKNVKIG
ncbi:copper resistance CopC/CopD family protein [Streptomyces gobiensis]|uniref:copper resistance CopC/CopD family protein n=1 Tax=Streptomyces gobiensis TaxID=2875706 RepID=UPI001E409B04|nr:copper resistance protein CopC [Streptomyces gobiensis]UGY92489.1 copper resistance protein CopC [Streptomyces gobiensis]